MSSSLRFLDRGLSLSNFVGGGGIMRATGSAFRISSGRRRGSSKVLEPFFLASPSPFGPLALPISVLGDVRLSISVVMLPRGIFCVLTDLA